MKPIPQLLCQIHTIFPPSLGLAPHDYFQGWIPIGWQELVTTTTTMAAGPPQSWDSEKLQRAVRKVRFFLHPDKLPRDLDESQQFLCKLCWDVINDAYEDHRQAFHTQ